MINMRCKAAMLLVIGLLLWMGDAVGCSSTFGQGSYSRIGPIRTDQLENDQQLLISRTIEANPAAADRGYALFNLGMDFEKQGQPQAAVAAYQEIVRTEAAQPANLEPRLAHARAALAVKYHWQDPQLRQTVSQLSLEDGLRLYREVGRTVTEHYVDKVDYRQLLVAGTYNLRAALQDAEFRQMWEIEGREMERATFVAALDRLQRRVLEDKDITGFAARAYLRNLCQESDRTVGLPCGVIISEFIFAAGEHLDNYSGFLTTEMYRDVLREIDGRFVGFGITIAKTPEGVVILDVIPQGPAQQAGIRPGDLIVAIDGTDVTDAALEEVVRKLRGESGTSATVTIVRESKRLDFDVRRQPVIVPSVRSIALMGPENSIGYVHLTSFQRSTATELAMALEALNEKTTLTGLVLDLRGNPGGLVDSAVDVSSMFLVDGIILTTSGRGGSQSRTYRVKRPRQQYTDLPMVVLTDSQTASASEIVAGALRDHDRAVLIGERTFGKGLVQSILPINFGRSAMYLTTARYYGPDGESFQTVGIEPHVLVAMPAAHAALMEPQDSPEPQYIEPLDPQDNQARRRPGAAARAAVEALDSEQDAGQQGESGKQQDDRSTRDPVIRRAIEFLSPRQTAVANSYVGADAR